MTVTSGHTHTEGQRKTTENRERHPVGAQRCTKDPESSEEAQTRGRPARDCGLPVQSSPCQMCVLLKRKKQKARPKGVNGYDPTPGQGNPYPASLTDDDDDV